MFGPTKGTKKRYHSWTNELNKKLENLCKGKDIDFTKVNYNLIKAEQLS